MYRIVQVFLAVVVTLSCYGQNTVYLESTEFGRGILKSRSGECFVIAPFHVLEESAGEDIAIYGEKSVLSQGELVKSFSNDIALVRIKSGGQQDCQPWNIDRRYDSILEQIFEGFLEIRHKDGSVQPLQVIIKNIDDQYFTVQPKNFREKFTKGVSGSSFFTNFEGNKIYLGMLQNIDDEDNSLGFVYQADDMERVLSGFFEEMKSRQKSSDTPYNSTITYDEVTFSTVSLGFQFDLLEIKKTGSNVTMKFKVVSLEKDQVFKMSYNSVYIYDNNGLFTNASNLTIGNQSGLHLNYDLIHGVPVTLEILFKNVSSSATGISMFKAALSNGQNTREIEKRNLSLSDEKEVITTTEKGLWSEDLLGFNFQLVDYSKTGTTVLIKFKVTSTEQDQVLKMSYNGAYIYDERGLVTRATNITVGNQSGLHINYGMVHGVQVDLEITFNQVSSSASGISFFTATISDSQNERYLQLRNLSFEGYDKELVLPEEKGLYSDNLLGFDIQLLDYSKTGSTVVFTFAVTSTEQDQWFRMSYNKVSIHDDRGVITGASNITIGNQSGLHANYYLINKVQTKLEITFQNVSSSATGVSMFKATVSDGKNQKELQWRDFSFSDKKQGEYKSQCSSIYFYRTNSPMQSEKPVYLMRGDQVIATLKLGSRYRAVICTEDTYEFAVKMDQSNISFMRTKIDIKSNENHYVKVACTLGVEMATLKTIDLEKGKRDIDNDKKFNSSLQLLTIQ